MSSSTIFDLAVCTIFAREFMEGAIIIGEYRTAILRSEHTPAGEGEEERPSKKQLLRAVNWSAFWAAVVAILIIVIVAIPLAVLSKNFSDAAADIIEGVSKVVAAIAILLLSLKIPRWLGFYKNRKKGKVQEGFDLSLKSVRFNVAWNIWREVAECGAFLLPNFLRGENLKAIPLSAIVGIIVGLIVGFGIYFANKAFKRKLPLAIFITLLLVFLSTGLFVGGCHEFEEVWGETHKVWKIQNPNMYHKKLPMAFFKPFGYSSSRTILQITSFWLWLALSAILHGFMIWRTKKINRELAELDATKGSEETPSTPSDAAERESQESPESPQKVENMPGDNKEGDNKEGDNKEGDNNESGDKNESRDIEAVA